MTATCYVTFGQQYRHAEHPVCVRAHPDGWFEYTAPTFQDASTAASRHLLADDGFGSKVALFAFVYEDRPSKAYYPRGCLVRFNVSTDGHVTEAAL